MAQCDGNGQATRPIAEVLESARLVLHLGSRRQDNTHTPFPITAYLVPPCDDRNCAALPWLSDRRSARSRGQRSCRRAAVARCAWRQHGHELFFIAAACVVAKGCLGGEGRMVQQATQAEPGQVSSHEAPAVPVPGTPITTGNKVTGPRCQGAACLVQLAPSKLATGMVDGALTLCGRPGDEMGQPACAASGCLRPFPSSSSPTYILPTVPHFLLTTFARSLIHARLSLTCWLARSVIPLTPTAILVAPPALSTRR